MLFITFFIFPLMIPAQSSCTLCFVSLSSSPVDAVIRKAVETETRRPQTPSSLTGKKSPWLYTSSCNGTHTLTRAHTHTCTVSPTYIRKQILLNAKVNNALKKSYKKGLQLHYRNTKPVSKNVQWIQFKHLSIVHVKAVHKMPENKVQVGCILATP